MIVDLLHLVRGASVVALLAALTVPPVAYAADAPAPRATAKAAAKRADAAAPKPADAAAPKAADAAAPLAVDATPSVFVPKKSDWVPKSKADAATAPRITVEELKKRIDAREKVTILDSRQPGSGAMIKGALSVPVERTEAWAKNVPKGTLIVCYCA